MSRVAQSGGVRCAGATEQGEEMLHLQVLLCLAPAVLAGRPEFPEEIREVVQMVHNTCVEKTDTTEEDIANCEKGIFKEDQKLKCYMFCLFEEGNFADEEGVVDYDMMVSMIPEPWTQRVAEIIKVCKAEDTPDKEKCQRAFDVHRCSYKQAPDIYFLF